MQILASFNYSHSEPAVTLGTMLALGIAAVLIWSGRPWLAAAIGAVAWSALAYVVGLAGQGDMTGLFAILYAGMAAPPGAAIAGVGAWIKMRRDSSAAPQERSME